MPAFGSGPQGLATKPVQRFIPGPGARREIRIRTTFMRMVNPTLSAIQNRQPLVVHPLPRRTRL
jgi:hypothetical protein